MGNFSLDRPIYHLIRNLREILILNLLWLICSLPIFTIGASTTALYYVALKIASKEVEEPIYKSFFRSFKMNFRQSTIIWVIYLVLGGILVTSFYNLLVNSQEPSLFIIGITVLISALYIFSLLYTFPILARYHNSIARTMLNSFFLSIRYFKRTLFMALFVVALAYIGFYFRTVLFFILVFGVGIFAYFVSVYMFKIFDSIENRQEEEWHQNEESSESAVDGDAMEDEFISQDKEEI